MKKTFRLSFIKTHKGCYSDQRIDKLIQEFKQNTNKSTVNILDVLNSNISIKDKEWFLWNNCNLSLKQKRELSLSLAWAVLPIFETKYSKDKRVRECLQAIEDFNNNLIHEDQLIIKKKAVDAAAADAAAAYADAAAAAADAAAAYADAAAAVCVDAAYAADAAAAAAAAAAAVCVDAAYAAAVAAAAAAAACVDAGDAADAAAAAAAAADAAAAVCVDAAYAADAAAAADAAVTADAVICFSELTYSQKLLQILINFVKNN